MHTVHDGPATFPAEAQAPWFAWSKAMDQAILTGQPPSQWPSLSRSLRPNEEVPFVARVKSHLERAQALGADRCDLWASALAALAPNLRKNYGVHREFQTNIWNAEGTWNVRQDEGDNLGALLLASWGEPWAPQHQPRAPEMSFWSQAHEEAPWAYHLLQAWLSSSVTRGWGQEGMPVDSHPSPFGQVIRKLYGQVKEQSTSHWRTWAHHVALVRLAGMPQDPEMRALADEWHLGWPKDWKGPGLNAAAMSLHLHARQAAVGQTSAQGRKEDWTSPVELLFSFAMDVHLKETLEVPKRPPTWMTWLREGLALRQGQPPALFKDATGVQGWATWHQRVMSAASWSLPADFEVQQSSQNRRRLWTLAIEQKTEMWQVLSRLESTESMVRQASSDEVMPARRSRMRT